MACSRSATRWRRSLLLCCFDSLLFLNDKEGRKLALGARGRNRHQRRAAARGGAFGYTGRLLNSTVLS
uniref:Secreted protein n=1 Tax=Setaria viridis TaxID=4556 RepID=A0A4U6TZ85_SETVI|nr:hypothetical protein SEVIR_7G287750v2 [Setaria viridis]